MTKRIIRVLAAATLSLLPAIYCHGAELEFRGNSLRVLSETPERNTGLDKIYIAYDMTGVSAVYHAADAAGVKCYRYSNLGGAYAEEVQVEKEGNDIVIPSTEGDMGYIVEEGDTRYYFWIVNYLPHRFSATSLSEGEGSDCMSTRLRFEGEASPIYYYTINGQQRVLSREIHLEYETQEWDETQSAFVNTHVSKIYESLGENVAVTPPPYCATYFTLTGDKFLTAWNWTQTVESSTVQPQAVAVETKAEQDTADMGDDYQSNQIKNNDAGGLGGSAPADIHFYAFATEGVLHHEWQMSRDADFEEVEYRFNQQNLDYTFTEEGTFYLRYIGSNADGTCDATGETYTVAIGASELKCPNAFSPNDDGVNDEWKVAYRSILEFECWIYDRQGHEMAHLTSPDQGWDGKRGGKTVPPGVYFYVIRAKGSDGTDYKLSGDINIIRRSSSGTSSGADTAE